jgi:RHS repeat-associated protein
VGSGTSQRVTTYEYDAAGRVTKKILPAAAGEPDSECTYAYEYSDAERKVSETDPCGRVTTRTYDDLGREVQTEGPGDYYALREYDESGNVIEERVRQQSTPAADIFKTARYRYDNLSHRIYSIVEGEGGATYTTSYSYDLEGNHYLTISPLGYATWYHHDLLGRLIRSELPYEGQTRIGTTYRNDALGRVTLTLEGKAGEGRDATRLAYDGLSRLRQVEQWSGPWDEQAHTGTGTASLTSYDIDLTGNLLETTDARLNSTSYSYDACGWPIAKQNPVGETEVYAYNAWGEMTARAYPDSGSSRALTFGYDGRGRLTSEGAVEGDPLTEVARIDYTYDACGNLTCAQEGDSSVDMFYEPATGRLSEVTSTAGTESYQTSYQYLQSGELALRQTEAGATTYAYDKAGRLTSITDPAYRTYSLTWDDESRLSSLALPSGEGHIDYTYYEGGQTETQIAYASMDELDPQASFTYAYNDAGKRESVQVAGLAGGDGEYGYEYDSLGRLTGFDAPSTANDITYAYDEAGNLTAKGASTYTYDDANRLQTGPEGTTYAYDDFGNLECILDAGSNPLETYTYDPLSRLETYVKGETDLSFTYDPLKRLAERIEGEDILSFSYDGTSLAQTGETAGTQEVSFTLTPSGTHLAQEAAGVISYLGLDPHQDITFALDSAGNLSGSRVYDPYGNQLSGDDPCDLGYQSDYTDPSASLIWMGARWYSPVHGRFLSEDPKPGEMEKPMTQNPYPYCACDPVNFNDLSGKYYDPNGGNINESDAAEPTISWDVSSAPEGTSTGEYWDSMADPIQAERVAERERWNRRRIIQRIKNQIIETRKAAIEAGLKNPWRQGLILAESAMNIENLLHHYGVMEDLMEDLSVAGLKKTIAKLRKAEGDIAFRNFMEGLLAIASLDESELNRILTELELESMIRDTFGYGYGNYKTKLFLKLYGYLSISPVSGYVSGSIPGVKCTYDTNSGVDVKFGIYGFSFGAGYKYDSTPEEEPGPTVEIEAGPVGIEFEQDRDINPSVSISIGFPLGVGGSIWWWPKKD